MQKDLRTLFGIHHGLDPKSVDFLTKALEKNNLPGFDYLEFKQSLAALASMDMDQATAMKSSFATASTVGLTKEKLVQTAMHYQQILNKEKHQFDAALQKQVEQRIAGKQQEVETLRKQIIQYQGQIKQLEERIQRSQGTIDSADDHIEQARTKIEATKSNFDHAFQSIFNEINKDIEDIKTYL